ncbi:unnamed protein product [Caenorhabditis auriculariae]|uniref:Uncharacterized protein n=1 Tax=Caenorhabditis auriculariae TaxID=2777116 RepID=A0A8S1GUI0_9PELO|nr:unnamed protein product [Caenorhabditis auriculariae]
MWVWFLVAGVLQANCEKVLMKMFADVGIGIHCPSGNKVYVHPISGDLQLCKQQLGVYNETSCPGGTACERFPILIPGFQDYCCWSDDASDNEEVIVGTTTAVPRELFPFTEGPRKERPVVDALIEKPEEEEVNIQESIFPAIRRPDDKGGDITDDEDIEWEFETTKRPKKPRSRKVTTTTTEEPITTTTTKKAATRRLPRCNDPDQSVFIDFGNRLRDCYFQQCLRGYKCEFNREIRRFICCGKQSVEVPPAGLPPIPAPVPIISRPFRPGPRPFGMINDGDPVPESTTPKTVLTVWNKREKDEHGRERRIRKHERAVDWDDEGCGCGGGGGYEGGYGCGCPYGASRPEERSDDYSDLSLPQIEDSGPRQRPMDSETQQIPPPTNPNGCPFPSQNSFNAAPPPSPPEPKPLTGCPMAPKNENWNENENWPAYPNENQNQNQNSNNNQRPTGPDNNWNDENEPNYPNRNDWNNNYENMNNHPSPADPPEPKPVCPPMARRKGGNQEDMNGNGCPFRRPENKNPEREEWNQNGCPFNPSPYPFNCCNNKNTDCNGRNAPKQINSRPPKEQGPPRSFNKLQANGPKNRPNGNGQRNMTSQGPPRNGPPPPPPRRPPQTFAKLEGGNKPQQQRIRPKPFENNSGPRGSLTGGTLENFAKKTPTPSESRMGAATGWSRNFGSTGQNSKKNVLPAASGSSQPENLKKRPSWVEEFNDGLPEPPKQEAPSERSNQKPPPSGPHQVQNRPRPQNGQPKNRNGRPPTPPRPPPVKSEPRDQQERRPKNLNPKGPLPRTGTIRVRSSVVCAAGAEYREGDRIPKCVPPALDSCPSSHRRCIMSPNVGYNVCCTS